MQLLQETYRQGCEKAFTFATFVSCPLQFIQPLFYSSNIGSQGIPAFFVNVAVTLFDASIVTAQPPVPVHAPDHPANTDPSAGVAVRVTDVPFA